MKILIPSSQCGLLPQALQYLRRTCTLHINGPLLSITLHSFRLYKVSQVHSSPDRIPIIRPGVSYLIKRHLQKVWNCSGKHDVYLMLQFCVGKPTITILELINLSEQSKCQSPRVEKRKKRKKKLWWRTLIFYNRLHTVTLWTHTGCGCTEDWVKVCAHRVAAMKNRVWGCDWAEDIEPLLRFALEDMMIFQHDGVYSVLKPGIIFSFYVAADKH